MTLGVTVWAQGAQVPFGAAADPEAPVEVTSDKLDVDQNDGSAVFAGSVIVAQGEMRLSAPRVKVIYNQNRSRIERMVATGGVILVSGPDAAESDKAEYTVDSGVVVMTGNVLLTQEASALTSDWMTVNLANNTAQMKGRVKTILQTGGN